MANDEIVDDILPPQASVTSELRLIHATSLEWAQWLARVPHDFYHTAAYHLCAYQCGEGEPLMLVYGQPTRFIAWPYLLRRVPTCLGLETSEYMDVASVYGYSGPLVCGCADDHDFLAAAWDAMTDLWRSQRVVSVFTRFHPLLENHRTFAHMFDGKTEIQRDNGRVERTELVLCGPTVSIDLTLSDAENVRDYQKVLRQEIAQGRRRGLTTEVDEDWRYVDEFVTLYHRTMSRAHASPGYFFSADYFRRLRLAVAPHIHLIVTKCDGQVAAAGIFAEYRGVVQAHLAGINQEMRAVSPLKILLDDVRRWAHDRGAQVLHLGGGRGGREDSLLSFKARFSQRRHQFCVGRSILDVEAYDGLCELRERCARQAGLQLDSSEFFPRYRARFE